jgi:hypothetical protein
MRSGGNRWWHLPNRSPGTGSTSVLWPAGRFHRPATTCWPASSTGADVALTLGLTLYQSPDRRMISFKAAFLQRPLNIPQRQRISKIPADRTENQRWLCLPPLEDRRSRSHLTFLSRCQPGSTEVATQPELAGCPPFLCTRQNPQSAALLKFSAAVSDHSGRVGEHHVERSSVLRHLDAHHRAAELESTGTVVADDIGNWKRPALESASPNVPGIGDCDVALAVGW